MKTRSRILLCLSLWLVLGSEAPARAADRDERLQTAFLRFPLLAPMTNAAGQPAFQSLDLTNPIVINRNHFYGFRFQVPGRQHQEDFVWAFVEPADGCEWYILPQKGGLAGFTEFFKMSRDDYADTQSLLPPHRSQLFLQSLPGENLEDSQAYLVWFKIGGKRPAMSLAFTFARLQPPDGTERPIARALGLKRLALDLPLSPVLVNQANHHRYLLLRPATWKESEAQAVALGGHLATVRNQAEEDWIFHTFGSYGGLQHLLWIGLSDRDKKFHFTWSSGESVAYTAWAKGEPNNAGRGEDFVAIYYPNHSQHNRWNDWSDRTLDPLDLPVCGVVEIIPPESAGSTVAGAAPAGPNPGASPEAVPISPALIITNDSGSIKLEWPLAFSHYMLEATTNLARPFTMFGYSELTNAETGLVYVTITNPSAKMFFRLRKP